MAQTHATAIGPTYRTSEDMHVAYRWGESYEVTVRGHRIAVDQPVESGGDDLAPTPTELFVSSLATCVAFYAGRYLTRHGYTRDGLGVTISYRMAEDRPARVTDIRMTVRVPAELPSVRWKALHAVISHCTVHNSLVTPPAVQIELTAAEDDCGMEASG